MPTCKCITFLFRNILPALVILGYLSVCTSLAVNGTVNWLAPSMPSVCRLCQWWVELAKTGGWADALPHGDWGWRRHGRVFLVHSSYNNRIPSPRWLIHNKNVFLTVLEMANPGAGCQRGWVLARAFCWDVVFPCILAWWRGPEKMRELSGVLWVGWGIVDLLHYISLKCTV